MDEHVHARRVVLQGAVQAAEVCVEWGLAAYIDTYANLMRDSADRLVKRSETMVLLHAGRWTDSAAGGATGPSDTDGLQTVPGSTDASASAVGPARALAAVARWRRLAWRHQVFCSRCSSRCPAGGAMAATAGGRVVRLRFGGLAARMACEHGRVEQLQCAECARSEYGRGAQRWVTLPLPAMARGRLLAGGGELAGLLRDRLGVAVEIPQRDGPAEAQVFGTLEQHRRADGALRVLAAGGRRANLLAQIAESEVRALGLGVAGRAAAARPATAARSGSTPAAAMPADGPARRDAGGQAGDRQRRDLRRREQRVREGSAVAAGSGGGVGRDGSEHAERWRIRPRPKSCSRLKAIR